MGVDTVSNTDRMVFVNALGEEQPLNLSAPYHRAGGWQGRFMPPFEIIASETPFVDGSQIDDINVNSRETDYSVVVNAGSAEELRQKLRNMGSKLNASLGLGWLKAYTFDGKVRKIKALYKAGYELSEHGDDSGDYWQKMAITFFHPYPYWIEDNEIGYEFSVDSDVSGWFPIFPLSLSTSSIFASKNVVVSGDAETFPIWEITGSAQHLVVSNVTTGKSFSIPSLSLGDGEKLYINSEEQTLLTADGQSLYSEKMGSLFKLKKGNNNIKVQLNNASSITRVGLSFGNRWLTP